MGMIKTPTWREIARPIIQKVIHETGAEDMKLLRKKLREAYPFGERKYFPYKVWCDEIKVQLGLKTFGRQPKPDDPNQLKLFTEEN